MTVFVVLREDQNEHGFVDTSISGIFRAVSDAKAFESKERARAIAQGFVVESDDDRDVDWQVSWRVEEHDVD